MSTHHQKKNIGVPQCDNPQAHPFAAIEPGGTFFDRHDQLIATSA